MQRMARVVCSVLLAALVGACAYTVFAEPEPFLWSAPGGKPWTLANSGTVPTGGEWGMPTYPGQIEEYVPEGGNIEEWQQLVTVFRTYISDLKSPKDLYEELRGIREDRCPGSTRWNIVEESRRTLIFESWAGACLGFPPHYEMATLVYGTRDRVKFAFVHKGTTVDPQLREAWIATMRGAHFGKAPG